jgi:hypothetical protein
MKKSELKQLIKEVLQEAKIRKFVFTVDFFHSPTDSGNRYTYKIDAADLGIAVDLLRNQIKKENPNLTYAIQDVATS